MGPSLLELLLGVLVDDVLNAVDLFGDELAFGLDRLQRGAHPGIQLGVLDLVADHDARRDGPEVHTELDDLFLVGEDSVLEGRLFGSGLHSVLLVVGSHYRQCKYREKGKPL